MQSKPSPRCGELVSSLEKLNHKANPPEGVQNALARISASPLVVAGFVNPAAINNERLLHWVYGSWDLSLVAGEVLSLAVRTDASDEWLELVSETAPTFLATYHYYNKESHRAYKLLVENLALNLAKLLENRSWWRRAKLHVQRPDERAHNTPLEAEAKLLIWAIKETSLVWFRIWRTVVNNSGRHDGERSVLGFLYSIARNAAMDIVRQIEPVVWDDAIPIAAVLGGERKPWELIAAMILEFQSDRSDQDAMDRCNRLTYEYRAVPDAGAMWPGVTPWDLLAEFEKAEANDRQKFIEELRGDLAVVVDASGAPADCLKTWWDGANSRDRQIYRLSENYGTGQISAILRIAESTVSKLHGVIREAQMKSLLRTYPEVRDKERSKILILRHLVFLTISIVQKGLRKKLGQATDRQANELTESILELALERLAGESGPVSLDQYREILAQCEEEVLANLQGANFPGGAAVGAN